MGYSLGIDIGTTFSAAAIFRDGRVEVVPLGSSRVTVPTVMFTDADGLLFGTEALFRGGSHPEGVAREFKRRLGDSVPVILSGAPFSADRLVALFARWMVDTVSEQLGEAPERIVITHPANWTAFQLNLLRQALGHVDLDAARFLSEPEAALDDFSSTAKIEPGQLILVYDLGGGTFDLALLRCEGDTFAVVGEPAGVERLGGIDFDEAVFQHVVRNLPDDAIRTARETVPGRIALTQLRRACVEAKEELSSSVATEIPVILPGTTTSVRLTRSEFEAMIRPMLLETMALTRQLLTRAEVGADDLSAVLLIGGASRTPLVADLVRSELDVAVRIDAHPKLVVARGAARPGSARPAPPVTRARPRRLIVGVGLGLLVVALAGGGLLWLRDRDSGSSSPAATTTTATTIGGGPTTSVTDVAFLGVATIGSDVAVDALAIRGLSGIAYDSDGDRYDVISDDPAAPHLYRISIDLADGRLDQSDVHVVDALVLTGANGATFAAGEVQPEAIILAANGDITVGDEGDAALLNPPSIREFGSDGQLHTDVASPAWYRPVADGSSGIGSGGGFRALTAMPAPTPMVIVGAALPLAQDAKASGQQPFARLLKYDPASGTPVAEYGYPLDAPRAASTGSTTSTIAVAAAPAVDVARLEDLVALDGAGTLLALEHVTRDDVQTTRIYEVELPDVEAAPPTPERPPPLVSKRLLVDFDAEGLPNGDFQGLSLGPVLADGRRSLLAVSDNLSGQTVLGDTQITAFAMELSTS